MKLSKSHPFVRQILLAEKIERRTGKVTDEVLKIRKDLKERYPGYFTAYLKAKTKKQELSSKPSKKVSRWLSQPASQFAKPYIAKSKNEQLKRLLKKRDNEKNDHHPSHQ